MSIGITTAVLFAVFAALLFLGCPISVGIVISSIVAAVSSLSWDQITFNHHAKNETRGWKAFPFLQSRCLSWQET